MIAYRKVNRMSVSRAHHSPRCGSVGYAVRGMDSSVKSCHCQRPRPTVFMGFVVGLIVGSAIPWFNPYAAGHTSPGVGSTRDAVRTAKEEGFRLGRVDGVAQSEDSLQERYARYWPRKVIVLFGPPGAGKSTQSRQIEEELGLVKLSTGEMLRRAVEDRSALGMQAEAKMQSGDLVPDDVVLGIIRERIKAADCKTGFILDGFPRNVAQAKSLDVLLKGMGDAVSVALDFSIKDSVIEERIVGRWVHKPSGRTYHARLKPPKSYNAKFAPSSANMRDDETGEPLHQRRDDTVTALRKRLAVYHAETVPVLAHYTGVVTVVEADRTVAEVWRDVKRALRLRQYSED